MIVRPEGNRSKDKPAHRRERKRVNIEVTTMEKTDCPQCKNFQETINQLVTKGGIYPNGKPDAFLETCKIETELLCAIDSLDHVVYGIGEGTEFMTVNVQIGIIKGAISIIEQQIVDLGQMRIPHQGAAPDQPEVAGEKVTVEKIGRLIKQTFDAGYDEESGKVLSDLLQEIYMRIYPNAMNPAFPDLE